MTSGSDYEVGYGKPPKKTQFKKGQSGNPKGRRKGVRNFQSEINDILKSKVTVTEDGRQKSVHTTRAALMRLKEKALKGDQRALERLLDYAHESSVIATAASRERELNRLDREILERFVDSVGKSESDGPDNV